MYRDRAEAGRLLAERLAPLAGRRDALVLGVPRGGLAVARPLADALGLPLEACLARKLGMPGDPECAIGAVGLDTVELDAEAERLLPPEWLAREVARVRAELERRRALYYGRRRPRSARGLTAILADDGAATGFTLLEAIRCLRGEGAARVIVAVPVASVDAARRLRAAADEAVLLEVAPDFRAVGEHYRDFSQLEDAEAARLLRPGNVA